MTLAEYLASEQAREDVRLVVAKPHDVLRYSGNGGPWLERTTLKAWTRLGIEGADQYITAYYRPDGDRYVVTDMGEGVRALRLKGVDAVHAGDQIHEILAADWVAAPEKDKTRFPFRLLNSEIGFPMAIEARWLPDALCRVMLASLKVSEVQP